MKDFIYEKLFLSGKTVRYNGQLFTINHVLIGRGKLLVSLHGLDKPVDSEDLDIEPTKLSLKRH